MLCCLALLSPWAAAYEPPPDWELIHDQDGVRTWRAPQTDGRVYPLSAHAIVDVPLGTLLGLFLDPTRTAEWAYQLVEIQIYPRPEPDLVVEWQRYALGWPFSEREFLMERRTRVDPVQRTVSMFYHSIEDPAFPVGEGRVRATNHDSWWKFTAIDGGRTEIEFRAAVDPRGSLPAWLVNLTQKSYPHDSIVRLAERAKKGDIQPDPTYSGW
jgi:hypothetical protein